MSSEGNIKPNQDRQVDRVRQRILIPFSLVLLFIIVSFVVSIYIFERNEHADILLKKLNSVVRLIDRSVNTDAAMMQAALIAISQNSLIRQAFQVGDRERLLELTQPLFKSLSTNNNITHFYLSDPNRVNILRVHQPDRYGDIINRTTTLRAQKTGNVVKGIDLGPLGTLTVRAVLPWYWDGRLIGFLELGEEIEHITDQVLNIMDAGILVLVQDRYLNREAWEAGRQMLGRHEKWIQFGSLVVVGHSLKKIPPALGEALINGAIQTSGSLMIHEGGKEYFTSFLPLRDITTNSIGKIVVVQDVTGTREGLYWLMATIALISVAVGGVVFVLFYILLGHVERDYKRKHEVELQLARLNTKHQRVVQLEKLSAMGLMVGEIAHQLNNPLVGVVNMAQLAVREINNPERLEGLLSDIGQAGKDCHGFVKHMLEFTKVSCFELQTTNLNTLATETVALCQQSIGRKAKVELNLPEQTPELNIDPGLIRHALFNLLVNAVQSGPEHGTVILRLQEQSKDGRRGWEFYVQDEGPGVPEELREKVFTPFFSTRAEGTGLGLPVVQHVAILHEGEVSIMSSAEGGAIFAFWIPENN